MIRIIKNNVILIHIFFFRILELENSLEYSKKQLDKLKSYIKKEEKNKSLLEEQLLDDKKKMKDLCKEYNLEVRYFFFNFYGLI